MREAKDGTRDGYVGSGNGFRRTFGRLVRAFPWPKRKNDVLLRCSKLLGMCQRANTDGAEVELGTLAFCAAPGTDLERSPFSMRYRPPMSALETGRTGCAAAEWRKGHQRGQADCDAEEASTL